MEKENNFGAGTAVQKKRKRSANWDSSEKILLRNCINDFVRIIENKNTDTNTNKAKKGAWQKITERFNELNHGPRTMVEIKQQWRTTKTEAKKKFFDYKKARNETCGGPKPPSPDPETSTIIEMIPKEFEVDFNQFDSDTINLELEDMKTNIEMSMDTGVSTADSVDVVQETMKSSMHNKENDQVFITPTQSTSRFQRNSSSQGKYSRRKLSVDVNEFARQRNHLLQKCVEEEHKLKITQMKESHEWAKEEHFLRMKEAEMRIKEGQLRIKKLEIENEMLNANLNLKSED